MMLETKTLTNPFPGLRPFETDEYRLFFGREGQSDALITRLQRARFLAVVGTSGSGKSSLVRAGLLPALRGGMMAGAGPGWRIAIMRPGSDPFANLASALAEKDVLAEAGGGLPAGEAEAVIEATLRRGSLGLVDAARHARLGEHEKLLVLVDQFEELFRFRAARAATNTGDEASAFVKLMIEAAQQRELSIYVVLTMRSDFLGDCAQFQGLPEAINEGQYLIPRMTRDERRMAITGPVGVTRGKMTEPLINRLLNDVGDNPDQLPILQHALMRTWDYWAAHRRDGEPIGLEHYEAIGTMTEALSLHADEAWGDLPDQRSRQVAEKLFKALTEKGADNREIRHPTQLAEISAAAEVTEAEVIAVIEIFRRADRSFLMPPVGVALNGDTVIDISHESLIRNWERLQKWVDEEAQSARIYHRLAEAAVLHREGKEGLLQDPALQIGLDWREQSRPNVAWAKRYHSEFETAIGFLDESRKHRDAELAEHERQRQEKIERDRRDLEQAQVYAEQQRRVAQRMRRFTFALVIISLLAFSGVVGAVYALDQANKQRENAKKSESEAVKEKEKAEAATIALQVSKTSLERTTGDLQKSVDEFKKAEKGRLEQTEIAKERAEAAQKAEKKAQDEATNAIKAAKQADAARKLAESNAQRGDLMREGLEYRQREDDRARFAFDSLITSLDEALRTPPNQATKDEIERLTKDLGWAHSNLAGAWLLTSDLTAAKTSYETARSILERVWPKDDRTNHPPDPILFETYNGLGHVYQEIALAGYDAINGRSEKIDSKIYFKNAEDLFLDALNFHKARARLPDVHMQELAAEKQGVAEGHLNLARLYRDMGKTKEAEQSLKDLVEARNDLGDREALYTALRELAEFYRNRTLSGGEETGKLNPEARLELKENLDKAEATYNQLLDAEEEGITNVTGYAKVTQDITSNYNELAYVYRGLAEYHLGEAKNAREAAAKSKESGNSQNETLKMKEATSSDEAARDKLDKANAATRAVSVIQSLSRRLRLLLTAPETTASGKADDRDDLADAVADIYSQLNKFDKALKLYEYALEIRKNATVKADRDMLWKSYDNLTKLYRKHGKDDPKAAEYDQQAEKYNQDLIEICKIEYPGSPRYAGALMQLAALYADIYSTDPAKSAEVDSLYREALAIYVSRRDWAQEDVILFRLAKFYEKQKQASQQEKWLRKRVETLSGYVKQLGNTAAEQPKDPVNLVSEYLYAVNALAYFYPRNSVAAQAVYRGAFEASGVITGKIYNEKVLSFYVATLDDFKKTLKEPDQQTEAAKVQELAKSVRENLVVIRQGSLDAKPAATQ